MPDLEQETLTERCECGSQIRYSGYRAREIATDWRASHRHANSAGICGDAPPGSGWPDSMPRPFCTLRAGHAGMHGDDEGSHWTERADTPEVRDEQREGQA